VNSLRAILLSLACGLAAVAALVAAGPSDARSASAPNAAGSPAAAATHRPKHTRDACPATHQRHRRHPRRRCAMATRGRHGKAARHATHVGRSQRLQTAAGARRQAEHAVPIDARGAGRGQAEPVPLSGASASATIARVLATPCQNTELTPEAGNLQLLDEATMCLVNQVRARGGELPLRVNAQLTQVAQQHSEDMVGEDYFSHTTPSGETQLERVMASGYIPNSQVGYTVGENIAWGTLYLATPSAIVAAWIASPEHLANILSAEYRDSGIGVVAAVPASLGDGQAGAIYTQDFGAIQD
jgi:uncharacterized protein YkwD